MHRSILLVVALAATACGDLPGRAQAGIFCGHHGWCGGCSSCVVYQGCGNPSWCGYPYAGCRHHCGLLSRLFHCHAWHGCGCGWNNCGWTDYGWNDCGATACADGCYSDGAWSDGAIGYRDDGIPVGAGESEYEVQSDVIYDGPAAGREQIPTPVPADDSASIRRPTHRLASFRRQGSDAFDLGLTFYREGRLNEAAAQFEQAADAQPENALYQYYNALAIYDQFGADAAGDALRQAVQAEQRHGVTNWGQAMERVQGLGRLWIEKARRDAGLVR